VSNQQAQPAKPNQPTKPPTLIEIRDEAPRVEVHEIEGVAYVRGDFMLRLTELPAGGSLADLEKILERKVGRAVDKFVGFSDIHLFDLRFTTLEDVVVNGADMILKRTVIRLDPVWRGERIDLGTLDRATYQ
jgi:hypothetical protein